MLSKLRSRRNLRIMVAVARIVSLLMALLATQVVDQLN